MSQSQQAAKSAVIIIIFTIASKLLGFLRESLIAAKFGSGVETDTFFIAMAAIGLFTSVITQSINTTMIPVLSSVEIAEGKEGKNRHTNNLLNIIMILSFIITIIAWILSPLVIRMIASGFEGEQYQLAIILMRIGLPAIIFSSIIGVFRGFLQSELMFTESAVSQLPFNFVYIFFLVFMSSFFGIKGLMVTSVLAVAVQIIFQIPGLRKNGFKYRLEMDLKDKYIRRIIHLLPPVLISVAVGDLNKVIDKSLASRLVDGSISALNYASRLEGLITGIFIATITTVIFPMLSSAANKKTFDELKRTIVHGINITLLIALPSTVGMIILAKPIVKIAFQRGEFDETATMMTVGALIFYVVGLVFTGLKSLLLRVFYSLQDTKTPMVNSIIAVILNFIFNIALIGVMEHRGLALATSISAAVTTFFLFLKLRKKIGPFGLLESVSCGLKSLFATIVMGVVVYFIYTGLGSILVGNTILELIHLLIAVAIGGLIYLVLIYILKVKELEWAVENIKKKIKK